MLRQLIDIFTQHSDPDKLRQVIYKQRAIIIRLQTENAQLTRENRRLRRKLRDVEMRLLNQAEADSLLLGAMFFAGLPTSRRACQSVGIGSRHWRRAVALLQVGRASDGRNILVETVEDFQRAVRLAKQRIERDGMDVIKWRLPLCYKR